MSEEMKNGNVSLAMEAQEPIVAEVDNDVALDIDVPNDIEITLDQPEVISQELSGDSAVGMIAGSLNSLAKDSTIAEESEKLSKKIDNIDLSPVEKKVEEVGSKIDNIKLPEIDTTNIASKDLERFFGVKPIDGYEFMTAEEVCSTLEEIMTTMDIDLTPEQAKEITNNTLNKE